MTEIIQIRSISFDTSFLLKNNISIDTVIKMIAKDKIDCFITSTVISELEQLKIWGRTSSSVYKNAIKRYKKAHATVIDFKNRFLSNAFGRTCILSMEKHHGIKSEDIANDCNILISTLVTPTLMDKEKYNHLKEIGVDNIGIAVDASTPGVLLQTG